METTRMVTNKWPVSTLVAQGNDGMKPTFDEGQAKYNNYPYYSTNAAPAQRDYAESPTDRHRRGLRCAAW